MALDIQLNSPSKTIDLAEKGRRDGETISLDRRLFMQFMAFSQAVETGPYIEALQQRRIPGALYLDINDPRGLGLLIFSEDPEDFLHGIRSLLNAPPFDTLQIKPEFTMLGRTYSIGYEEDLEETLFTRPTKRITDPTLPWAIWYPVRRSGAFEHLSAEERRTILMEHGGIGRAYGKSNLAYDIRLACFGLDKNDNDFIVGLLGRELYPLSHIVERMRKTQQTSSYLTSLGPFFIGKAVWQNRNTDREV